MISSVRRALEMRRLVLENRRLRKAAAEAEQDFPLFGETPVMVRLRETIRQLASVDVDVLIEGETGTGKELVARLLHRWSSRHARGFVAIDCAALPDAIADDVLFGNRIQRGRIADADRGTLFSMKSTACPLLYRASFCVLLKSANCPAQLVSREQ